MIKPVTDSGLLRLWKNMKAYIAANTYPRSGPPELYFDPATSTLYQGKPNVGYDFIVEDGRLYYKERGGTD